MKLILTRHGETEENIARIIQGRLNGTLSKNGLKQIKKLALRLKKEKIDAIYSSDLDRAKKTAQAIIKYHPNSKVYFVEELREIDHGVYTGKSVDSINWEKIHLNKEIEPRKDILKRVKRILGKAIKKYPHGTVMFVGHGGINNALICNLLDIPGKSSGKIKQSNTAVNIFEINEDGKTKLHLLNCIKHLK